MREEKYSALSALLDFYSDRATAHASYFVAFTFGLFTILYLAEDTVNLERLLLVILSWVVWGSGLYCLLNFGFYANLAERIKGAIRGGIQLPFKDDEENRFICQKVENLSIPQIDEGILNDLVVNWRGTIIRGSLFLGRLKLSERYRDWRKTQPIGEERPHAKMDLLYLVYLLIFAFASLVVFGIPTQLSLTLDFGVQLLNIIFLLFSAGSILRDLNLFRKGLSKFQRLILGARHEGSGPMRRHT